MLFQRDAKEVGKVLGFHCPFSVSAICASAHGIRGLVSKKVVLWPGPAAAIAVITTNAIV